MTNQYKLGVGPMSPEIINAILSYKNKDKLMVVASRNQVDYKDAYVCNQYDLALRVKPNGVFLCRDHCGPYFKDSDKGLTLRQAVDECKKTIESDCLAGFDLIHIDTSKIDDQKFEIAKELFDYAIALNPNMLFEFGSEENTGSGIAESIDRLIPQLNFAKTYSGIRYFVSQTGSLTKHRQAGQFEVGPNTILANTIHSYRMLFKEHNADYLDKKDLTLRELAGVDAMNIAPQLGYIQTCLLEEMANGNAAWQAFSDLVYAGDKWQRWVDPGVTDKAIAVRAAGHYYYSSKECGAIYASFNYAGLETLLTEKIHKLFDHYLGINNLTGEIR